MLLLLGKATILYSHIRSSQYTKKRELTRRRFMKTPMTAAYMKDEEQIKYLMGRVPQQRFGEPEDLVGALLYLASPASNFVNGTTVIVDGGYCGK
jgi:NAD(P)-dependent dehydrogenase (short-subunit alcohol dehydrogenase family)